MRRIRTSLVALSAITFLFALFIYPGNSKSWISYGESFYEKIQVFTTILETLQKNYVDERSADELLEGAISGMLARLDPHTNYLPPDNFKKWNQSFEGYTGVGILFDIVGQYPIITGFISDSPAEKSGLEASDVIVKINGQSTKGLKAEDITDRIVQSPFPNVTFTVYSRSTAKTQKVTIKRTHIDVESIPGAYMLDQEIGYIHLERFSGSTASELDQRLEQLLAQGMEYLILDMRDNGGGYLSAAVEVADRFLPQDRLILFTKGRHSYSYQEFRAILSTNYEALPIAILINHGTASAAEIVAGALQDWDRAVVVGTTSFGKGLVQSQYRFRDGSALLITTARYYTPLGRLIQRDYQDLSKDEYYADAYTKAPYWENPEDESSHKIFKTLKGRTVYEGGGISPDFWVTNEHAEISDELRALYLDDNRFFYQFAMGLLSKYPEFKKIDPRQSAFLQITAEQLNGFKALLAKAEYPMDAYAFEANKDDIAFLIQRDVAYLLAGDEGKFHVNYLRDIQLQVAAKKRSAAARLISHEPLVDANHSRKGQ